MTSRTIPEALALAHEAGARVLAETAAATFVAHPDGTVNRTGIYPLKGMRLNLEAPCAECEDGLVERTIGGDGYGDACCGEADVPCICSDCDGTGFEREGVDDES